MVVGIEEPQQNLSLTNQTVTILPKRERSRGGSGLRDQSRSYSGTQQDTARVARGTCIEMKQYYYAVH